MAGSIVPPAQVLLSRRVQEMVLHGEEPPQPYMGRDDSTYDVSVPPPYMPPIIDLSLLSPDSSTAEDELQKLRSALSSWGCIQVIGHGIPKASLDKIRQVTSEFFQQSIEEKQRHAKLVEEFEGYGADPVPAEGQSLDWSDRLFLTVYPEDQRNLKFWPENPKSFREVLEGYTTEMKMLTELLSKSMAKSLNLVENCFLNQFGEKETLHARFNYYSRCQRPDLILGLKAHADGSGYTVILQDDVEGLQVLKDKNWITIPAVSDALLVLMGDQMEIMTNGIFKSPVHRVLTKLDKERISVAVFYTPEPKKEIGPEEGLINEERPRIFKKVKDYADVHWEYYQKGQRALHVASV
ncbi:codeine O-demethylase-like [Mercurialis annua]|uniref:codeine O-demethylase-like n=1 Tax=Mercurialis annua TaxID=3986 RepID=UPI0021601003|nr:codeine O-demethylase-like [Mercurialis annua]